MEERVRAVIPPFDNCSARLLTENIVTLPIDSVELYKLKINKH